MTTPNRTPRQTPGAGLVSLTVHVPLELKAELFVRATIEKRSVSYVARDALQRYLFPPPDDAA
jgi:hypothetical protein